MSAPTSIPSVVSFLANILPFSQLTKEQLAYCANSITVHFCDANAVADVIDYQSPFLYIVRTGEFEIRSPEGRLFDRLAEGDQFGYPALLSGKKIQNKVVVLQDGLIYRIGADAFRWLKNHNEDFDIHYTEAYAERIKKTSEPRAIPLTQPIGNVISRRPVLIAQEATIQQAAQLMSERQVSSLMVMHNESLVGIVTDRDLRSRVVATGRAITDAVAEIMTSDPAIIYEDETSEDVLAKMLQMQIHHMPVINQQQTVVGMVTTSDLIQMQISHPLFLLRRIQKSNRLEQLIKHSNELGNLLHQMISNNMRVIEIGRIISQISDALTVRLIELSLAELGEPPCEFCWLAFGSQGRSEQSANSDQDNGILLAREVSPKEAIFFDELAHRVNQGLDRCGFVLCPGDVMASNEKWRVSCKSWQRYFTNWIESPESKALMHASIFFDLRCVFGAASLVKNLQQKILQSAGDNSIFLAQLTQNALKTQVPLGFFKMFVLEQNGEHVPSLDLKHKGLAPIVDIARIYALAGNLTEINTLSRLHNIPADLLSKKDAEALSDAYRFISRVRYKHQLRCWQKGKRVDNYVIPSDLSSLQRAQLKDAFQVINEAQAGLKMKFARGLL